MCAGFNTETNKLNNGQWLWLSWYSCRFWHQRSAVSFQSSENLFIYSQLYWKDDNKRKKETGIGPDLKKNNFNNYLIGHNTCKLFPFLILPLLTYFALCSIWGWLHFSLSHFLSLSFASKQKGKNQLL